MIKHERLQLSLPFQHETSYYACDFIPAASNQDALRWLEADWPDRRLALFGPAGCGKSHLLHVWAGRTNAVILAGQTLADLEHVPQCGALVVDDADTVMNDQLLLHLLNTARDRGLCLLLSGRAAPSRWPVCLPDLSSRLRAITAIEIGRPDDELCSLLMMRLLADRQLAVATSVQEWLLRRLPRSPEVLREAVARLDRASMVHRSAITRPFAARVLAEADFDVTDLEDSVSPEVGTSSRLPGFL
jgi:chromosomal replication initiation ATPase DnaA